MTIDLTELQSINANLIQISQSVTEINEPLVQVKSGPQIASMELTLKWVEKAFHILQAVKSINATMHEIAERGGVKFDV